MVFYVRESDSMNECETLSCLLKDDGKEAAKNCLPFLSMKVITFVWCELIIACCIKLCFHQHLKCCVKLNYYETIKVVQMLTHVDDEDNL